MTEDTPDPPAGHVVGNDETAPDPSTAPAGAASEASEPGADDAAARQARAGAAGERYHETEGGKGRGIAGEVPGHRPRPKRPRDAVIYVPGLVHGENRVDVDALALRIASGLDRRARTRKARFSVSEAHVVEYREEVQSRRITIERQDPDQAPEPIVDVFEFDYRESIRERFERRAPIRQAIAIAWLLVANSRGYWEFLRQRGKNWGDKFQLLLATGILALIVVYLAMLLVTAVGTGVQAMRAMSDSLNEPAAGQAVTPTPAGAPAGAPSESGVEGRAPAAAALDVEGVSAAPAETPLAGSAAVEPATTARDAETRATTPDTIAGDEPSAEAPLSSPEAEPPAAETDTATSNSEDTAAPDPEPRSAPETPPAADPASDADGSGDGGDTLATGLEFLASMLGLSDRYEQALRMLQGIVVLLTALGLLTRNSIKQLIADMSIEYAAVINYISSPVERPELNGRFMDLIEHVHESEVEYRHIDVIGYSFGSVVAIDCVFGQQPPGPGLSAVSTLTTVGSPFDIIRSFFPRYFRGRRLPGGGGPRWLNIFSPEDILSSNFRDDQSVAAQGAIGVALAPEDGPRVGDDLKPEGFDPAAPMVVPRNMLYGPGGEAQRSWPWVRLVRQREIHLAYWGKSARATSFMADYIPARYEQGESPVD